MQLATPTPLPLATPSLSFCGPMEESLWLLAPTVEAADVYVALTLQAVAVLALLLLWLRDPLGGRHRTRGHRRTGGRHGGGTPSQHAAAVGAAAGISNHCRRHRPQVGPV